MHVLMEARMHVCQRARTLNLWHLLTCTLSIAHARSINPCLKSMLSCCTRLHNSKVHTHCAGRDVARAHKQMTPQTA
jgi:hypothetical protein